MNGWGVPAGALTPGARIHIEPHKVNGQVHGHREDVTLERGELVSAYLVALYWHPSRGCPGSSPTERGITVYERGTIVPQLGWETR